MKGFFRKRGAAFLLSVCWVLPLHAETLRWRCDYQTVSSPEGIKREAFRLEFALDTVTRKSVLIGNAGMADVEFHNGPDGITFLELLPTGAVQTTTATHLDGKSVHSRHSLIGGNVAPTQYYGVCK